VHRQPIQLIVCPVIFLACVVLLSGCCASESVDSAVKQQSPIDAYIDRRIAESRANEVAYFAFVGDMQAGERIELGDLKVIKIPSQYANAFGDDAIGESADKPGTPVEGLGTTLNVSVREGEVLRSGLFVGPIRGGPRVDPSLGERQIALSVESDKQPANLEPSDRVDLLAAIPRARSYEYHVVMENVEIAAVGERRVDADARAARYDSITINIKPDQIKQLLAIQDHLPDGQFRIALRAPIDSATSETDNAGVVNPEVLEMLRID